MTLGTLRYSFEIDGNTCGQMDVRRSSSYLRTVTEFETTATGHVLADFEVWFDGQDVVRARKKPHDWIAFSSLPDNAFPDCAYPLLIQRSLVSDFEYWCIDLEQEKRHVLHHISRTDDLIVETRDNQVLRRFLMDDDIPTWIDWGGRTFNPAITFHELVLLVKRSLDFGTSVAAKSADYRFAVGSTLHLQRKSEMTARAAA